MTMPPHVAFAIDQVSSLLAGICPVCRAPLPEQREFTRTCDAICHRLFIERVIAHFGETKDITDAATGKVYRVPMRVILEQGIRRADLARYPEVTP